MNKKLTEIVSNLVIFDGRIEVQNLKEILSLPSSSRNSLLTERSINIFSNEENWYFRCIIDGEILKFLSYNRFKFRDLEKIKKVFDVFRKAQKATYKFVIGEDIIEITFKDDTYENEDTYWIAITKKGISILNSFLTLNGNDYTKFQTGIPMLMIKTIIPLITMSQAHLESKKHLLTLMVKTSGIKQIDSNQKMNPSILKQIYEDTEPIVSKFFLRDFSLDNIYYDSNKKKYIIVGITDYLKYDPNIITISLSSFLSNNSLYLFKETQAIVSFDEFLIYMFNFNEMKGWWEYYE